MRLTEIWGITSDRLFLIDPLTIGHISKARREINIFSVNLADNHLTLIYKKHFFLSFPYDACSTSARNIFVVFPDQNKITKYIMYREQDFKLMLEADSLLDEGFFPSAISCSEGLFICICFIHYININLRVYII